MEGFVRKVDVNVFKMLSNNWARQNMVLKFFLTKFHEPLKLGFASQTKLEPARKPIIPASPALYVACRLQIWDPNTLQASFALFLQCLLQILLRPDEIVWSV